MKALSLTQPWATLVAIGAKRLETRTWSTQYQGPLALHAAQSFPAPARSLCLQEPYKSALAAHGYTLLNLPLGCLVGTVDLRGCAPTNMIVGAWLEQRYRGHCGPSLFQFPMELPPEEPERSFGDYAGGRFAWFLANARELPAPIPQRGMLSLFEVKLPELVGPR